MGQVYHLEQRRRAELTGKVLALLDRWQIPTPQQAPLLGFNAPLKPRQFRRYRKGMPFPADPELMRRIECLLAIQEALSRLFPHSAAGADFWLTTENRYFQHHTPLRYILEHGQEGLEQVLEHLRGTGDWGSTPHA